MHDNVPLYDLSYPWLPADDYRPVACSVCGGVGEETAYFLINGERFSIQRCEHDDLMFLSPQPGDRYLEALYSHPTYYEGSDDMYGMSTDDTKSGAIATMRIKELIPYGAATGPFLELGSAYGHTLTAALSAGFRPVIGIEYGSEAVARARAKGLDVRQGSIDEDFASIVSDMQFSTIALYSVLEHVRDPKRLLEHVRGLLAPDGIVVIRVPDTPATGPTLSLVDHLWHFTRAGLTRLLISLGYEVLDTFPSGTFKGVQHPNQSLASVTIVARKAC